jgi:hypothetical protein
VCLPGLTTLGTLSLSCLILLLSVPISTFSLPFPSSPSSHPPPSILSIPLEHPPPTHARLFCLSGLKGEKSLFDRNLPRSLVVEPPGTL